MPSIIKEITEKDTLVAKLSAACITARNSIMRFPGDVHDRALAKIDKALGTDSVFIDPDEKLIADLRKQVSTLTAQNTRLRASESIMRKAAINRWRDLHGDDIAYSVENLEHTAGELLADGEEERNKLRLELEERRDAVLEEAALISEAKAKEFLSPEYAVDQPASSMQERFACKQVAMAIRAAKTKSEESQ